MLKWLNSNGVESDEGFIVQSIGRFEIEYREGDKKVNVYVENGMHEGKPCVIIMEPNEFSRWDGDPPGSIIPPERQTQMLGNFIAALEFQGLSVVVNR